MKDPVKKIDEPVVDLMDETADDLTFESVDDLTDESANDLSLASKAESPVELAIKLGSWLDRFVRLPAGATRDPEESCLYHYCPESLLTPLEVLANFSIPINEVGFIAFNQKAIPVDCKIREAGLLNFYPMIIGG